jgi:hypothetical protein
MDGFYKKAELVAVSLGESKVSYRNPWLMPLSAAFRLGDGQSSANEAASFVSESRIVRRWRMAHSLKMS